MLKVGIATTNARPARTALRLSDLDFKTPFPLHAPARDPRDPAMTGPATIKAGTSLPFRPTAQFFGVRLSDPPQSARRASAYARPFFAVVRAMIWPQDKDLLL